MGALTDDIAALPVVVLCGGQGIYIDGTGQRRNKALIRVAGQAMVSLVMKIYARVGFRIFILAAGIQADAIRAVIVTDHGGRIDETDSGLYIGAVGEASCQIRVVDTTTAATTGDRLKQCRFFVQDSPHFCLTYSDTLAAVDLREVIRFHDDHGRLATLLAANHPVRFRIIGARPGENHVRGFAPRPVLEAEPINGGFYVFNRAIFDDRYLGIRGAQVVLEDEVLDQLAADQQLMAFRHAGRWQNLDSERDIKPLVEISQWLS